MGFSVGQLVSTKDDDGDLVGRIEAEASAVKEKLFYVRFTDGSVQRLETGDLSEVSDPDVIRSAMTDLEKLRHGGGPREAFSQTPRIGKALGAIAALFAIKGIQ